jgi:hypothetical protein
MSIVRDASERHHLDGGFFGNLGLFDFFGMRTSPLKIEEVFRADLESLRRFVGSCKGS